MLHEASRVFSWSFSEEEAERRKTFFVTDWSRVGRVGGLFRAPGARRDREVARSSFLRSFRGRTDRRILGAKTAPLPPPTLSHPRQGFLSFRCCSRVESISAT